MENRSHLKLVEVVSPAEKHRNSLPPDVQWEGNVPLIPLRGRAEPLTNEMVRDLLEDGELEDGE